MLPRVFLHNSISLDGRIDGFPADLGQFYELAARRKEDAILEGADTIYPGAGRLTVWSPKAACLSASWLIMNLNAPRVSTLNPRPKSPQN